jgi:hypothetical protein
MSAAMFEKATTGKKHLLGRITFFQNETSQSGEAINHARTQQSQALVGNTITLGVATLS